MPDKRASIYSKVFITIGIFFAIITMAVPVLSKNQQETENTVISIQKTYSSLLNAYKIAKKEKGFPDNWNLEEDASPKGAENILKSLIPSFKLAKYCGNDDGCFNPSTYKNLNNAPSYTFDSDAAWAKVQLEDGSSLAIYSLGGYASYSVSEIPLQNVCGFIAVDTNGIKKPNQIGGDTFMFYLTKYGIIPMGNPQDTAISFNSRCRDKKTADGWGCTAWVIYNKNLDYSRCSDLSWSSKRKCS